MSILCFYHANCVDGFFSALAVYLAKGSENTVFIPVHLNRDDTYENIIKTKEQYKNVAEIYFVDVIGPEDSCIKIAEAYPNAPVIILDHHLTSMKYLSGQILPPNLEIKMDIEHSGAILCYNYFKINNEALRFYFELVEDYDLWKFNHPQTKAFTEGIRYYNFTTDVKKDAVKTFDRFLNLEKSLIIEKGEKVVREMFEKIDEILTATPPKNVSLTVGERTFKCKLLIVESFPTGLNDMGNKIAVMAQDEGLDPIGIIMYSSGEVYRASVRSLTDSSLISTFFGGGGHACASAFNCQKADLEKFVEF